MDRGIREIPKVPRPFAGHPEGLAPQHRLAVFPVREAEPIGPAARPLISEAAPFLAALVLAIVLVDAGRARLARQFDDCRGFDYRDDFVGHVVTAD